MATAENTTAGELVPAELTPEQNAIAILEASQFIAVRPSSDIREAMEHNMKTGDTINEQDLTRVPIPGGRAPAKWAIDSMGNEEVVDEIVGSLVYYGVRGVLWPSEDPTNAQPVLVSHDLQLATRVNDELGDLDKDILEKAHVEGRIYDWTKLKYNEFGTARNGNGKRAKESRILCVLRPGDAYPLLINAGPGSLKTICPFVKKLPVPHFRAVVGLKLQSVVNKGGQAYYQILPRLVASLSREEGAVLKQLYTDPLFNVIRKIAPVAADYNGQNGDE